MTKEQKFYEALQDVFIGAKIEGTGGFVNLMKKDLKITLKAPTSPMNKSEI